MVATCAVFFRKGCSKHAAAAVEYEDEKHGQPSAIPDFVLVLTVNYFHEIAAV